MAPPAKRFRILSLDGGGIKGAFTAAVLAEWEQRLGHVIVDHFDLITGTSTGGIIALGLGLGIPAVEILRFYKEHGPKIFPNVTAQQKLSLNLRHLWEPKYSAEPLREALRGVFGDKRLKDSKCRLLIPAYDVVAGRIYQFKTRHDSRFIFDKTLWWSRSHSRLQLRQLFSNRLKFLRIQARSTLMGRMGQLPSLACSH